MFSLKYFLAKFYEMFVSIKSMAKTCIINREQTIRELRFKLCILSQKV